MRLDLVHIHGHDRDAMTIWCQGVLGLRPANSFAAWDQDGGPRFLQTSDGQNALALFQRAANAPTDVGDHTVAFALDASGFMALWTDADRVQLQHPSGQHLKTVGPVDHDGLAWSLYFVSPERHRFEVTPYETDKVAERLL